MAEPTEQDPLLLKIRKWFKIDKAYSANWRKEAKEDFAFVAGDQWSDEDKRRLKDLMRPVITFNRILPVINSISGQEMGNRQEVRFIPRTEGDVKPNELLTSAAEWFRDLANADDEDSEAFLNSIICGMGWTETTLDFEDNEAGEPDVNSVNPLEMVWDRNARKKNLTDAERVYRVRLMARSRAKQMFPEAQDGDLDAKWAKMDDGEGEITNQDEDDKYEDNGEDGVDRPDSMVTVVHCQWRERVNEVRVVDWAGRETVMSEKDYKTLKKRLDGLGMPYASTRRSRNVIKQAWVGGKVLRHNEALCRTHFHYQCITAHQDKNKGTFFGLVHQMKDPQRWANKWLSQALDILNNQAKGGIMAERGAVENQREFEKDWARSDKVSWFNNGALSQKKVQEKPGGQMPTGFMQLMEFAISSVRDVTGVSVEMLGMREADQAASLEYQRRQAGMTIMQPLFANLKRYRHDQGRIMLYLIQNYLSDGRLVRVVGEENEQFVPLMKESEAEYDIIVDDQPTSPNQKEATWAALTQSGLLGQLPPNVQLALLDSSPLPSSTVEKVRKAAAESPLPPEVQQAIEEGKATIEKLETENAEMKANRELDLMKLGVEKSSDELAAQAEIRKNELEERKLAIEAFKAETERAALGGDAANSNGGVSMVRIPPLGAGAIEQELETVEVRMMSVEQQLQRLTQTTDVRLQRLTQATESLLAVTQAPKRLVRDEEGRPVGVEIAGGPRMATG